VEEVALHTDQEQVHIPFVVLASFLAASSAHAPSLPTASSFVVVAALYAPSLAILEEPS